MPMMPVLVMSNDNYDACYTYDACNSCEVEGIFRDQEKSNVLFSIQIQAFCGEDPVY